MTRVHNVLVIGSGVSGLTTALVLARRTADGKPRFSVKLWAERPAEKTVSVIAGALWEFPPAVCGQHGNPLSLMRSKRWCMTSYQEFGRLAALSEETGVRMRAANFYFNTPVEAVRTERLKLNELERLAEQEVLRGLRRLTGAEMGAVPERFGVKDGYRLLAPAIDTPLYVRWLRGEAERAGVEFIKPSEGAPMRVTGRLVPQEAALRERFGVDAIVNCTGLGAAELAGAAMVPLRGALLRIPRSTWSHGSDPQEAHVIAKSEDAQDMVFVVPRVNDVMFGGLVEPGEYDTAIGKEYPPVRTMFERCRAFLPDVLGPFRLDDPAIEVDVGLRPYRVENVCLEREHGFPLVHNYGHGGSGFSFSYGCAEEAADLVEGCLVR